MKASYGSVTAAAIVLGFLPLWAHHAWPVNQQVLVTVKGKVVAVEWANPHPMYTLEVTNEKGEVEEWKVGGPALNRMQANGWTKETLKAGDVITGIGNQYTDGQKVVRLERVILADGKEMLAYAQDGKGKDKDKGKGGKGKDGGGKGKDKGEK